MFHAFGYRLIPRIRNLGDRRLFVIHSDSAYDPLDVLIGGTINMGRIEPHWDEVLRLCASVAAGLVPPSVILKKIAATRRQNGLSVALREIGRIERSIFICDWLLDPKLRRRSHAILNKGESRHALARAVFFINSANCATALPRQWPTAPRASTSSSTRSSCGTPSISAAPSGSCTTRAPLTLEPYRADRRLSMERDRPPPRTLPPDPRQPLQSQELRLSLAYTAEETPTEPLLAPPVGLRPP